MHHQYSIQLIDQDTGYILTEIYVDEYNSHLIKPNLLRIILAINPNSAMEIKEEIPQFDEIRLKSEYPLSVRAVHEVVSLPYRSHSGREFDLMMKGLKPLSVFSYVKKSSPLELFLKRYFIPEVERGRLLERRIVSEMDDSETDVTLKILYTRPDELWRIEVYITLLDAAKLSGWNDSLEYFEGFILGYSRAEYLLDAIPANEGNEMGIGYFLHITW